MRQDKSFLKYVLLLPHSCCKGFTSTFRDMCGNNRHCMTTTGVCSKHIIWLWWTPFSVLWAERYSPVSKNVFIVYVLLFACGNDFYFWYNRLKVIEDELIQASTKKFSLEKFYKEPSVSSKQMVDCCKRLLGQSLPYLQGMHLCVSHFYSVMQDGDLCIPWNWKNGEAIKWHKPVLFFKELRTKLLT